jgi:hypothetical protein
MESPWKQINMEREMKHYVLYNKILTTGDVPSIWRDVTITVLHKGKGSKEDCGNKFNGA